VRFLAIALIVFVGATEALADPQFSDSDLLDGNWSSQVFVLRIGSGGVGVVSMRRATDSPRNLQRLV